MSRRRIECLLGLAIALAAAGCEAEGARPTATIVAADTADQMIIGFSHNMTDNGVRRGFIEADTAYYYESSQNQLLIDVRARFYGKEGGNETTLTARQATYNILDGSMRATGDVQVNGPDGQRLRSEVLVYDKAADLVSTDQPFTYDAGEEHLEGTGFRADPAFENVVTNQPRGTAGGEMVLPGQ